VLVRNNMTLAATYILPRYGFLFRLVMAKR
jgi:hypothetical protein